VSNSIQVFRAILVTGPAKHTDEDFEMIKKIIIAAALAATFAMTASASVVRTDAVTVPYQGAVVSTEQGQAVLEARLKRAAKQVCGTTHRTNAGSLTQVMKNRACYEKSLDSAMSKAGLKASNNS
jgi:UrcA family protein